MECSYCLLLLLGPRKDGMKIRVFINPKRSSSRRHMDLFGLLHSLIKQKVSRLLYVCCCDDVYVCDLLDGQNVIRFGFACKRKATRSDVLTLGSRSHRDNEEQVFVPTTYFLTSVAMNVSSGKINDSTVTDLVSLKGMGGRSMGLCDSFATDL
ncbi:hypothetical protein Tco_0704384 [Tanacetum coccineum]|uniref:Uncharacterized protein n=1 Tax=Tanacetum coccineum TaxID=301880 RepID=A0ABQ4Y372_9ASTR